MRSQEWLGYKNSGIAETEEESGDYFESTNVTEVSLVAVFRGRLRLVQHPALPAIWKIPNHVLIGEWRGPQQAKRNQTNYDENSQECVANALQHERSIAAIGLNTSRYRMKLQPGAAIWVC
jgi:hypothetical protein